MVRESRPNRVLSIAGLSAGSRIPPVCDALWRRCAAAGLLLLGPVSFDGLRPTDLSGQPSRYRNLPAFSGRQALPHGLSRPCVAFHAGRRQRYARLAHLCRLRTGAHPHGSTAVCLRSHRRGPGTQPLIWSDLVKPPPGLTGFESGRLASARGQLAFCLLAQASCRVPAGAARREIDPAGTARSSQGRAAVWRGEANP